MHGDVLKCGYFSKEFSDAYQDLEMHTTPRCIPLDLEMRTTRECPHEIEEETEVILI